jgi:hypothetical protein
MIVNGNLRINIYMVDSTSTIQVRTVMMFPHILTISPLLWNKIWMSLLTSLNF